MVGSWEIRQQMQVQVAILHTDTTTMHWSLGLRNLIIPGPDILPLSGMPFDMARNTACVEMIRRGCEWIFFLDSDVVPPRDAILRLMSRNQPIISGVYHRRSPPAGVPVMMKPVGTWITHYPPNSLIEVDVVGAGCLLIHRTVFESLPPQREGYPWFDWRVNLQGSQTMPAHMLPLSEDFTFCMHAKMHGYRIMVETGVQCRHLGLAQATYGSLTPAECNPNT